ncbi:winged helix-turn-helix domain-containing protein [Ekhidna sp.]|uniref:winged helix-turn-helix domain-containing protein n=1 Tax=Ekhidna sp. TaxID=2608089 RepID=UPI003B510B9E
MRFRFIFCVINCFLISSLIAQDVFTEKHIEVSLRMVGHKILLNAGDSTSRVMPIVKEGNQYRIEFESEFGFIPEDLVITISDVMLQSNIDDRYIVEVEECTFKQIVYSFEKSKRASHNDLVACSVRNMQLGCYSLIFTFLDSAVSTTKLTTEVESKADDDLLLPVGIGVIILFGIGIIAFVNSKKSTKPDHLIELGKYRFDLRNAVLILKEQKTELTGKEADLLQLLYSSMNAPVKRDAILNKVWGDEGNYIGRTLDVYVSKLRNKLQADPTIKIVNIRGVGYKLVIDK